MEKIEKSSKKDRARLRDMAAEVFGSKKKSAAWLDKEATALGGKKPGEAMKTKEGAQQVGMLLTRIMHGVYS